MHKFQNFVDINISNLKLSSTIDQTGIYLYLYDNLSKVIAEYVKPLASNDCRISDILSFSSLLKDHPLDKNEESVS